ncbi:MAG: alpha-galactosidase [Defluviitaleaceae bacterium]|nr:alpha-galactosidase [Defluviitaleaceae bacterium]
MPAKRVEKEILSEITCGDMIFQYVMDKATRNVGLVIIPAGFLDQIDAGKEYGVFSIVQVKLIGDEGFDGLFGKGRTMLNSLSAANFKFENQDVTETEAGKTIVTRLKNGAGVILEHKLTWYTGYPAVELTSALVNDSAVEVAIEMLSSFALGGITPFEAGDTPDTLLMHRLGSRWADEGRLETVAVEEAGLEPSFTRVSVNSLRYGQVGTMPVREFFPFIAIEDKKRGVCWGAQVAWPGSWQIEAYRKDEALCIAGGLADREFGHWMKKIAPGARFVTPKAIISVGTGGVDEISQRLTSLQYKAWVENSPAIEKDLPIVFSEWCTTWGNGNADIIRKIADAIAGKGINYFAEDAGWYDSHGTWNVDPAKFPEGLDKTVAMLRDKGMITGLWFEYEDCDAHSPVYAAEDEHMLKLDGVAITSNGRHFWDMRNPYSVEYLSRQVIDLLEKYGIGYLKIDYNETIGIGCDGAESPGEGLRRHVEAMLDFVGKIKQRLPELVIENCSSGGGRLEPCMMGLATFGGASDAHENVHIPIIAANMHRAIQPCQNFVWAVVRPGDTARRLHYTMAGAFLGRMYMSGDIYDMSAAQWEVIDKGIAFYKHIAPVIRRGFSRRYGPHVLSHLHPEGWQALVRVSEDKTAAYAVIHTFGANVPEEIEVCLPDGLEYEIDGIFAEDAGAVTLTGNMLKVRTEAVFQGFGVSLKLRKGRSA